MPVHLAAFLGLFIIALRLSEAAYIEAGADVSRLWMRQVLLELASPDFVPGTSGTDAHDFAGLVERHGVIDFLLYDVDAKPLGLPGSRSESRFRNGLEEFRRASDRDRFWLAVADEGSRVRGLVRVLAEDSCLSCHEAGRTLGFASVSIDFTEPLGRIRRDLRRNLALLIVFWSVLVWFVSSIVRRWAERFASRISRDLKETWPAPAPGLASYGGLALDPVSAEVHRSILPFLQERREREAEVAKRMAHTDRLASLGRLAAGLVHEIKNPLAGIQGALEILREDVSENAPNRDLCSQMLEELERVNQTLHLLLSSARPSEPRFVEVEVGKLLAEIHLLLEPGLRRQGVELSLELPPGRHVVRLDAAKIRQVLVNLIDNAAEAIEGRGRIQIRAAAFPGSDGVAITVEDDGPGVSEENREQIFEPFFTTKFNGTGLGLALARRFVEQHGGTLEQESSQSGGCRFYVILPGPDPDRVATQLDGEEE